MPRRVWDYARVYRSDVDETVVDSSLFVCSGFVTSVASRRWITADSLPAVPQPHSLLWTQLHHYIVIILCVSWEQRSSKTNVIVGWEYLSLEHLVNNNYFIISTCYGWNQHQYDEFTHVQSTFNMWILYEIVGTVYNDGGALFGERNIPN